MGIFNPPKGTPASKPANIQQYPDYPQIGQQTGSSMGGKNSLSVQAPGGKSVRQTNSKG